MKKRLTILAASVLLTVSSLPAANIAWVSFHPADGTPSANATTAGFTNAPDAGYTKLLTANGHTVNRFVTIDSAQNNPDLMAAINTNNLVIISRSVPSGHYDSDAERTNWHTSVTVPLISMGGYINRNNRLGFHTGDTIPDNNSTQMRLRVNSPSHPIFNGIALDATNTMVNPYSQRVYFTNETTGVATNYQAGISVVTSPVISGGTILATVGTGGDAAFGGMVIGEFPPGINSSRTNQMAARRLVFLSGSREANGLTSEGSGIFDLLPDGQTLFLNAVTYLTTPQAPKCTLSPVGATNLVAGDAWTFTAGPIGDAPLTYQWYKNGQPLATGTDPALAFTSLLTSDAGEYYLILTNNVGKATSTVARIEFMVPGTASITNSLISYWPLDSIVGTKTPDLVSGYDLTLNNVAPTNILAGRWNNAFGFYNASSSALGRVNNPGEALPIYQHPNFSVSFWVQGPTTLYQSSADHRVFCEANSFSNAPMFSIGTHNATATDGTVDIFIRNDANVASPNHQHSVAAPYTDYIWHNVVYVQRDVGNGNHRAQLWIDGVLDSLVVPPARPLTANTTALGALLRGSYQAYFDGSLDEVALWNRALTSEEVAILQLTSMTNPPVRTLPLAINTFKADLPAVPAGSTNVLRWDVSKDASVVSISGIGDVTSQTIVGAGLRVVTNSQATTYVLTVQRGSDTLSATTTVAVVEGVAPGWNLLENFDRYTPGSLSAQGYWNNPGGTSVQVVDLNGNPSVRTVAGNSVGFLPLYGWSLREGQFRTLFYRLIPGTETSINTTNMAGITDKSQRDFADAYQNIGPFLYASAFTNEAALISTNAWYVGARNGYDVIGDNATAAITYADPNLTVGLYPLQAGVVYNIWMDITNASLATYESDIFSVYIQKEGDASRTLLFQNYFSDRDPIYSDAVLGAAGPTLDKLVVLGNNGTAANNAYFDDFYLSTSGYNATVPRAYGNTGRQPATLSIDWEGTQLRIQFGSGTLQQSTDLTNWTDVNGNPPSPYLFTPTVNTLFFRTR